MGRSSTKPKGPAWPTRAAASAMPRGCQRAPDSSEVCVDALAWLGGQGRDPAVAAEARAVGLLDVNRGILRDFGVDASVRRRGGASVIELHTSSRVGAFPLVSPLTGRPDFGLVIEPRFEWPSLGAVLATTGFRVIPQLLPLHELPQSERHVPRWVMSSVVLARVQALLDRLARRFTVTEADLSAPRGAVRWERYANERIAAGRATEVPCTFPDLRDDEDLRAAIHVTLRAQREALLSQRAAGAVVLQLLARCDELLARVRGTPPRPPRSATFAAWKRQPMKSAAYREGLQAIEWTTDERGLAGLSDLEGLAWMLDMEVFFEAWVETLAERVARATGSRLRVGRRGETRASLAWHPAHAGSLRSLVPDVVIERDDTVVVLDAKYKRHAEQLDREGWARVAEVVRERHRADVHQALAYSTLFDASRVVTCLVYPMSDDAFRSLVERGQVVTRARVPAGHRRVELAIVAAPMSASPEDTTRAVEELVRAPLE
ncbi:MAG: hypothetical protein U0326_24100 [Polyangiales bacterium]